jgi:hypothetical protein
VIASSIFALPGTEAAQKYNLKDRALMLEMAMRTTASFANYLSDMRKVSSPRRSS